MTFMTKFTRASFNALLRGTAFYYAASFCVSIPLLQLITARIGLLRLTRSSSAHDCVSMIASWWSVVSALI